MNIVASIRPLAIPTHERFDRFILGKAERVVESRGGCIALLGAFPEFAVIGA